MRRASIRELHLNTSAIVKEASEGEVIVVERHGVPMAELRPVSLARPRKSLPRRDNYLRRFPKVKSDSGRILEEDRS
jgi:antitoxin (DNA-binding transcriptional repressor) of toxin-antitoxin stability system